MTIDSGKKQAGTRPKSSARRAAVARKMNYPAASCGVSINIYDNSPKVVTPECFYRGSSHGSTVLTMTLRPVEWVRVSPGFPLKACGNDGRNPSPLCSKLRGINPKQIKKI